MKRFTLLLAATVVVAVVGCGRVEQRPLGPHPIRSTGGRLGPTPSEPAEPSDLDPSTPGGPDDGVTGETPPPVPTPTGFADSPAVACAGRPSTGQVVAALRRDRDVLPAGVTPKATTGPLCAGTWQYTVLELPGHDPLQVVSQGPATAVKIVTAGTYVCTPAVRAAAPAGIRAAAHCE